MSSSPVKRFAGAIRRRSSMLFGMGDLPCDNALDVLGEHNIIFLVDDSGSMEGSRWNEVTKALGGVATTVYQYNANGIEINFLNSQVTGPQIRTTDDVSTLLSQVPPKGPSPTGRRLDQLLTEYIDGIDRAKVENTRSPKVAFVVITDGVPDDDPLEVIIRAARRLDAGHVLTGQVGIQFIQVGDDPKATRALREIRSGLGPNNRARDIVDITTKRKLLTEERIIRRIVRGISKRTNAR